MAWSEAKKEYYRRNPMQRAEENRKARARHARRNPKVTIKCEGCGILFERKRKDQKYHDGECRKAAYLRENEPQEKTTVYSRRMQAKLF